MEQKVSHLLRQCSFEQLKQIHGITVTSSLSQLATISSQLLRRSTEFGHMEYAELVFFYRSEGPEILLWNAMIRGYAYNGPFDKCIHMYEEMPERGLWANNFTYPYVFDACTQLGFLGVGKKIHCRVIKVGFESSSSVGASLFNFYVRLGVCDARNEKLDDARRIFDGLATKSVGLWNRMISEHAELGEVKSARSLFDEMPVRDVVSWNCMISGYLKTRDLDNAIELFGKMPEKNVVSWTSMIGAFADSGNLTTARRLFEDMPERNVVSWNCIISSYTRHKKFEEALSLLFQMQSSGLVADGFTFVSILSACSHLGALEIGKWIHFYQIGDVSRLGALVGTSMVEMYAKCGDIDNAFRVFIKMTTKDVFCWNVMIKSLAIHGRIEDSMKLFTMMKNGGLLMNDFTFTSVLFACNHGGLINEGRQIFQTLKSFGIQPKLVHYGCMVDLLSRNGRLEEAILVMKEMPFEPDIAVWGALLGGCRVKNDPAMAAKAMERITELASNEAGVYVLLSNIYAASEQWSKALRTREKMEKETACKIAGYSSVLGTVNFCS